MTRYPIHYTYSTSDLLTENEIRDSAIDPADLETQRAASARSAACNRWLELRYPNETAARRRIRSTLTLTYESGETVFLVKVARSRWVASDGEVWTDGVVDEELDNVNCVIFRFDDPKVR